MLAVGEDNDLIVLENPQDVLVEKVLQELRLWKGEKQIDVEAGVDYMAVINRETFLKTEVERVLNKYLQYFKDVVIGDVIEENNGETLRLPITFFLSNGDIVSKDLVVSPA